MHFIHARRGLIALFIALLASFALTGPAAAWNANGTSVAGSGLNEFNHRSVPDGAGGFFLVYQDTSAATGYNIMARRIDAYGNELWTTAVSAEPGFQQKPDACFDPATGGIFVVWEDNRYGTWDIFALRVLADGQVLSWNIGGLRICAATGHQQGARVISDGTGGAIVTWADTRNGFLEDIYALRIDDLGNDVWANDGVPVAVQSFGQVNPEIITDGLGGALIAWEDYRNTLFNDADLYAQHMNAFGTAQWTTAGVPVCVTAGTQYQPRIASDGAGGIIEAWTDYRTGAPETYAQRVNSAGARVWASNGIVVSTPFVWAGTPAIAADGAGGALIAFNQYGAGWDIMASLVDASGTVIGPYGISQAANDQIWPSVSAAGPGRFAIAWQDSRDGNYDVYLQLFDTYWGPLWTYDGVPAGTNPKDEQLVQVHADADGNAIVTWQFRFASNDLDIYAQRIVGQSGEYGHADPTITSVADTPLDQGGYVMTTWGRSDLSALTHYTLWRRIGTAAANAPAASSTEGLSFVDPATLPLDFAGKAYRQEATASGLLITWEYITTVPNRYATAYAFHTPTWNDSMAGNPGEESYQVLAHNATWFYASNIVSGHSVDNLSPAAPFALAAQRVGNNVQLNWNGSGQNEPDFRDYAVYRAGSSGVQPIPIHFVNSSGGFDYTDVAPPVGFLYYIVTATDVHGNQSTPSNEAQVAIPTGIGETPSVPAALTLMPNAPNPFSAGTVFRLGAPAAGRARFEVYDVAGRRVTGGELPVAAGWKDVRFDGRDAAGRALASGVYFYRVQWNGQMQTHKMVIAR